MAISTVHTREQPRASDTRAGFGAGPDARIHPGVLAGTRSVAEALHALVRTRLAGGAAAPNPFQGVYVDPTDVERLLARPMVGVGDGDRRGQGGQDEQAPFALPPELAASPLGRVRDGLGLSLFETAVILLCLLPELDPRYASLFGFLHDDLTRKLPSVELALALFAPRGPDGLEYLRAFTPGAALRAWQLAHMPQDDTLIRQPLALDRALVWYLLGDAGPDASLGRAARVVPGSRELGEALPTTLAALDAAAGGPPLALLYGEDEHTCLGEAIAAAAALNRPLLLVDGTLLAEQETGVETLRRCLREAVLHGLLPCVTGAARLLRPASARAGEYSACLAVCPAPLILIAENVAEVGIAEAIPVAVPAPDVSGRIGLWEEATRARRIDADEGTLLALAETTGLSGTAIADVAAVAERTARAASEAPGGAHLQRAARAALRQRAVSLPLIAPHFDWDDIVLPSDRLQALRHVCSRVRYRSLVRQTWGMGHGTLPGVTALFAGEPGTGKSMAAEVVAADLGLDLCKIDLAQIVSKYIGETEKNLSRIFDEAERCGVVLVFDEADALFGKRSAVRDSHDRYANLETSYLLQRMERYRGLAVLTTNLRANLDEAFTRRIGVSIDFPVPAAADRLRIWRRALAGAPCDPALDPTELAERLELTGGAIVNVAVAAAHFAAEEKGAIDHDRLLRAMRWELQKMGRLMGGDMLDALTPVGAQGAGASRNGGNGRRAR